MGVDRKCGNSTTTITNDDDIVDVAWASDLPSTSGRWRHLVFAVRPRPNQWVTPGPVRFSSKSRYPTSRLRATRVVAKIPDGPAGPGKTFKGRDSSVFPYFFSLFPFYFGCLTYTYIMHIAPEQEVPIIYIRVPLRTTPSSPRAGYVTGRFELTRRVKNKKNYTLSLSSRYFRSP